MKFWRIDGPEYESDYDRLFINGHLDHPYGLPGIKCDACGQTWGGSRTLPIACPKDLRERKQIKERWPIPVDEHKQLQNEIMPRLGNIDIKLQPGDSFQPSYLDIASKPTADFLWCLFETAVVSERIRDFLLKIAPNDVTFIKVNKRKIGNREPKLPAPIPSTGEPEDIIHEVDFLQDANDVPDYYEMIPKFESKMPLNTRILSTCNKCGRENIDGKSRLLLMTDSIWNGQAIFYLSTTLFIIITEDVKHQLEKINPTNIRFVDITKMADVENEVKS